MSCHRFSKSSISRVILTYRRALVPYYPSKVFAIFETEDGGPDNITVSVKNQINAVILYHEYSLLIFKTEIPQLCFKFLR